jgi:vacuolar-type H+-ATPase subunit F/Vma7
MSTVAAIGETHGLEGFALVGVTIHAASTNAEIIDAWGNLDPDVGLVILSATAADALQPLLADRPDTLTVTMP